MYEKRVSQKRDKNVPICIILHFAKSDEAIASDATSYQRHRHFAHVASSIVFTFSHPPLSLSFHRETLLSPVLTARTFPLRLQLTRHATSSKIGSVVAVHSTGICQSKHYSWFSGVTHTSILTRPNLHCAILTGTGNIALPQDGTAPSHISDPV